MKNKNYLLALVGAIITFASPTFAENEPVSKYELEEPLFYLLEDLYVAAHLENLSSFIGHISPTFIMHRDFGGMTNEEGFGMPNFVAVFNLEATSRMSNGDGGFGWRNLENLLGASHFEKTETGYCGPYYSPGVSLTEREQLCFSKYKGEWVIDLLIGGGD